MIKREPRNFRPGTLEARVPFRVDNARALADYSFFTF
jgi:hypothetical protein